MIFVEKDYWNRACRRPPYKKPLPVEKVNQVIAKCKEQRLIIGKNGVTVAGYNNVLTLSPPLNITLEEKDFILATLVQAIESL